MKQVELAVELGDRYSASMISNVETGRSALLLDGAVKAAQTLNVSLDYLTGLTDDERPAADLAARINELQDSAAFAAPTEEGQHVDVLEVAPAGGAGADVDSERVTGRIKFRRTWLRRHGLVADNCRVLTVDGESMEPTLPDGCSILVNRSPRPRRVGRIFVVRTEDGLVVKRAGKDGAGRWQLVSDHPAWAPVPWPAGAEIVGEVRWAARTFA